MSENLYSRLGGEDALKAVINVFYDKVLPDPLVKHHFANANIISLKQHQLVFMTFVFDGGGKAYDMDKLAHSHQHLNITEEEFDAVCRHLKSALNELGVSPDLCKEVLDIVYTTHDYVVSV